LFLNTLLKTTNVTEKAVTFVHETNHGLSVVSHTCSC